MIELTDITKTVNLQFNIVGYEFPNSKDDWCLLKVIVQQSGNRFEKTDPALEIADLRTLYNWFNDLSKSQLPSDAKLRFTEPCFSLAFISYKNQIVTISITLSCELEPDFCLDAPYELQDNWTIFFKLSKDNLATILKHLKQWIVKFPYRT
ncbi:hypothetical protein A9G17_01830 [Gilliamella sp. wkB7]|uniref:WapI family immunity protein n=1 Tax=Gilliamella sp. wkB7 TaxID=3120264 RepID=UPI000810336B|nr:hypothetical protein [Gilliamella apicola]OCF91939.1 hypothetical protein A9G17_01830 [Gilliamella apicola]